MQQLILKIKTTFLTRDFIKFLIIGMINTFNGTLLSMIYSLFMGANVAFVGGYITSLCIAYWLNCKFIFYKKFEIRALAKFAISYIPNFIIQNVIVLVGYNLLELPRLIAYIIAACIGVPVTFICVKFFAFKSRRGL